MRMTTYTFAALIAGLAATTATMAGSHSGSDLPPAVKARHAHMQLYAFNLGALGAMAKGEMDYDAATATAAANNLATLAKLDQSRYWAPGTSADEVEGSRALPAIWEKSEDVGQKAADLVAATEAMAAAAGDGVEAIQANMRDLGGACSACHKAYRQSDE